MKYVGRIWIGVFLIFGCIMMGGIRAEAETITEGDYQYSELDDGTVAIKKYTGEESQVVIPSELGGKTVTGIGDSAFTFCENITSVTIPSAVTSIGKSAFFLCKSLEKVEFQPESQLKSIDKGAFGTCTQLTDIIIPMGVTTIGNEVFYQCTSLESIKIPASVTNIGDCTFYNCSGLISVEFQSGSELEWIPEGLFWRCTNLKEIELPSGITGIGDCVFSDCGSLESITIPSTVTQIGKSILVRCPGVERIQVAEENGVYSSSGNCIIDKENKRVIAGCKTSVIPEEITIIGEGAFSGCSELTDIEISSKVTTIESNAFSGCAGLTSVSNMSGVTSIGYAAFGGCSSLVEIRIPQGVTSLSERVFCGCSSLKAMKIPSGVTIISTEAFCGCSNLENVEIASDATSLSEHVFDPETSVDDINLQTKPYVSSLPKSALCACPSSLTIYVVPDSTAEKQVAESDYQIGYILSAEKCRVKILSGDEGDNEVEYMGTMDENATEITIPDTVSIKGITYKVTAVGQYAFSGNENIQKVVIGNNVKYIGNGTFSNCSSLKQVVLGDAVESISQDTFDGTPVEENKMSIYVPENLTDVSNVGIENITNIQYITIYVAEGSQAAIYLQQADTVNIVTYIGQQSAQADKKEEQKPEKTTPKPQVGKTYTVKNLKYKVTSSKYVTFTGATKKTIKTLTIPAKVTILGKSFQVTAIQKRALKKYTKLTTVVIGSNVKTIGDEAFMNCSKLKKITIGKNVKTIGKRVFYGDKKLTRIIFKGSKVTKIGKKTLYKVPKKVKITSPNKAVKKYKRLLNAAK